MSLAHGYHDSNVDGEGSYLLGGAVLRGSTPNREPPYSICGTLQIFFYPALGGLLFGFDIGATSAVVLQLQSSTYSGTLWYQTVEESSILQGVITSMSMLGAMIGCLICLRFADVIGRRGTLLFAAVFYFFGAVVQGLSGYPTWEVVDGVGALLTGRLIYGLGIGFAMQGAPAYIGEMAPTSIRGLLVSLKEAFIVLGILLGYSIGYFYSETPGGWRLTYAWATIPAVIMFSGMLCVPKSAPWLALRGRLNEALESMRFVTPRLSQTQIRSMHDLGERASFTYSLQRHKNSVCDLHNQLCAPTVYPAMLAGVGLVVFQQITGQPSVLYFADSLLAGVGITTSASIAISVFKLLATLVTTFTVDQYGRKRLLYIGCGLMLVALVTLAAALTRPYMSVGRCNEYLTLHSCPDTCQWDTSQEACRVDLVCPAGQDCTCCTARPIDIHKSVILMALFLYIGGYQVGFGPIVWLLISELFPLKVRGRAVAVAVVTNFFLGTVMTLLFPVEVHYLGAAVTFALYAVVLIVGIYFIYRSVPETKGMSLHDIEEFFAYGAQPEVNVNVNVNVSSVTQTQEVSWRNHHAVTSAQNERLQSLL